MNAKHTPAPWNVANPVGIYEGGKYRVESQNFGAHRICETDSEANARLIAAAPELLQALKLLRDELQGRWLTDLDCVKQAEAAIRKAEGDA